MKLERRSTNRERPEELSYIQFEPEGGGIVVNASEQGLAFHAAAALQQTGPIQLCVSPNPMQQIKLTAEIVWIDDTKKSGGVKFAELTAEARNQVLQWLSQTSESLGQTKKFTDPSRTLVEETGPAARPENRTPELQSPIPHNAMPVGFDSATPLVRRVPSIQATGSLPAPFSREVQVSVLHPRLLRGLTTTLLILVFLFLPVYFIRNLRQEIGDTLVRIGEKLKGNHDPQLDPSSSKPAQIPSPNSVTPSSVANPTPGTSANQALDHSDQVASAQTVQRAVNSADFPLVDRQNSPKSVALARARKSRSALARQLWSALGAGDSSAEVRLAQLYLTGDGVPRSCDQARVLLSAASKKGNIEALRQLQQLKKNTCR
jgi:hypothetical protein